MRNFLTAVALSATFVIASNAMAQNWWDDIDPYWVGDGTVSDSLDFSQLGIGNGGSANLSGGSQRVHELYLEGTPKSVNSSGSTTVNALYVTPDTAGSKGAFTGTGGTIQDFTLYVGTPIEIDDPYGAGSFGSADASAKSITMSANEINGVTNSFGSWAITGDKKVVNQGRIGTLTYSGGTYDGTTGEIGNLVVGTDITEKNAAYWGNVDNIGFGEDGGTVAGTGIYNAVTKVLTGSLNFESTGSIDLANGSVSLNMDGVMTFNEFLDWAYGQETFNIGDLLGWEIDGFGEDASLFTAADFAFSWEDTVFTLASFEADTEDRWAGDWAYSVADGAMTYTRAPGEGAVPEPATLAVLGLGLAGLGLVSRRRRK